MNAEDFRELCISLPGVEETFPFDETTLVFKVAGKMFALIGLNQANKVNLKCNPERSLELRGTYSGIEPGYHMNKTHWNTVHFFEDVPEPLIRELTIHSYELVRASLPKKVRDTLAELE
ncbi:MAG: MmcQ/YjbR family DNA-binding protein [Bacteroidia bacterium]|nr:MmcQ/YjbR family DNA-binding protein [Bacteroidia bacterium]